jgi:Cys-tRNA(Pro)/Cys-tRNA(Cys) deacylase
LLSASCPVSLGDHWVMRASTPAIAALLRAGIPHVVHRYDHDPSVASYGQEAAHALGVDGARIFKTLVSTVAGNLVVAVVPVTGDLDLKALAGAMGAKTAALADPADAERATGYVLGGISPVGQKRRLRTVLDERASAFNTIFVSAGRRGLEVELAPADLVAVTGATVAPIAKG